MVHTWYSHDTLGMDEVGAPGKHETHGTHVVYTWYTQGTHMIYL